MKFQPGDKVRKISGGKWRGTVVGTYSTELTPEGYAVESASEAGSVQIYPAKALEAWVEGAVDLGSDAWMALHLLDRLDVDADDELRVQQIEEIVRRMGAALSAVTAELGELKDSMAFRSSRIGRVEAERDQLRAEVERLRKDAARYQWLRGRLPGSAYRIAGVIYSEGGEGVDAAIEAAMAAKES